MDKMVCSPDKIIYDEFRGEYICTETGEVLEERVPMFEAVYNFIDANEKTRMRSELPFNTTSGRIGKRRVRSYTSVVINFVNDNVIEIVVMTPGNEYVFKIVSCGIPLNVSINMDLDLNRKARRYENQPLYAVLKGLLMRYGFTRVLNCVKVYKNGRELSMNSVLKQTYRYYRR